MTPNRLGLLLMFTAVVFWFIETAAFGWNFRPCCLAESICDWLAFVTFFLGVFTRWDFGITVRHSWGKDKP